MNWTTANAETDPYNLEKAYSRLDKIARNDFEEHCEYMKFENEDRIDNIISTIAMQNEKFSTSKRETINSVRLSSGDERIIRMHEGSIKKNSLRAEARIKEYESMRNQISTDSKDITLLTIRIHE